MTIGDDLDDMGSDRGGRRRRLTRVVLAVLGAAVACVGPADGRAAAHAVLVSSSPEPDSVLERSPTEIVLTFSEPVSTVPDSIRLVDATDGTEVELPRASQPGGTDTISVDVPELPDGSYVVSWRAISADSHPVSGAFVFGVGASSPTQPGLIDDLLEGSETPRSGETWLGVGRALSFAGVALLVGAGAITLWIVPVRLTSPRTGALLWTGCGAGVVGTIVMISSQASVIVDDWAAWGEVWATDSGQWWVIRLVLFVAAIPLVAARRAARPQSPWFTGYALFAALLVGVVAAGGHAVTGRWVLVGFAATVVHLVAMSLWLGGIAVLAVSPRGETWATAARFSPIALGSVAALVVTGTANAWRQSASFDALWNSSYGRWLLVKLVVVAAVVAIAAWNRRIVSARSPAPEAQSTTLKRLVVAELVGMGLILIATAGLVNSPPPRAEATAETATATVEAGGRVAQLSLVPAVTGGTTMHVYITNESGAIEEPTEITVTATLPAQDLGPIDIPVVFAAGHAFTNDADLPIPGRWEFTISARFDEFDATVFTTALDVTSGN